MDDFQVLETIRNEIQAEHTLISHRLSWYVTSQSFLMTAYAVAWNPGHALKPFFMFVLPALAIILSSLAYIGIDQAIKVQEDLIALQGRVLEGMKARLQSSEDVRRVDEYFSITGQKRPTLMKSHYIAMWPPKFIPVLFTLAWVAVFWFSWNK